MICRVTQLIGFYMIVTLAFNEFIRSLVFTTKMAMNSCKKFMRKNFD